MLASRLLWTTAVDQIRKMREDDEVEEEEDDILSDKAEFDIADETVIILSNDDSD